MKGADKGYVYILTNPSFREDWIKIGKSSRTVDVRSKELDNTSVPLPFDIYATLATRKYHEVEKLVHRNIDHLTKLRIRQNREFFNIPPQVALAIFKEIANIIDDAEITVYKDNKPISCITATATNSAFGDTPKHNAPSPYLLQLRFWEAFREDAPTDPTFMEAFTLPKAPARGYYTLPIGSSSFCISLSVSTRKRTIACELYMRDRKDFYHHLYAEREQFAREIGEHLYWEEALKDCRVLARRDDDFTQQSHWKEYFSWLRQTAIRMREAYLRRI